MAKQYGLIVPGKSNQKTTNVLGVKPSIFEDSDSDSEGPKKGIPTVAQKPRYQDFVAQQKALAEDPTVYQYDEVYDDIENKRKESKLARKDIDRKPKYINKLLQTAARRKREYECRVERGVQKERAAEGDEFKDKESFVTTSYRKKLEEMQELREQEEREEYLEAIGDVTKQADLGGFYRHLYEQQVKNIDEGAKSDSEIKSIISKGSTQTEVNNVENIENQSQNELKKVNSTLKRKYRKRDDSERQSDSEAENENKSCKKLQHLPSNLDADSDFSIDSSDNEDLVKEKHGSNENIDNNIKDTNSENTSNLLEVVKKDDKPLEFEPDIKEEIPPTVEVKPKIDIWKKRTVDEVFDEALKRYYMRKSARIEFVCKYSSQITDLKSYEETRKMPFRKARQNAEIIWARKRDMEQHHQQFWNNQRLYYETFDRANTRFQNWTSPELYAHNLEKYKQIEEEKQKQKELEEKRNKLDLQLHEERQRQEIALQEERRNKRRTYSRFDDTPTEVLKSVNYGLKTAEDAKRRHEAEIKLYHQWRANNPIIQDYERNHRTVGLKTAWLNAQIEKQMAKEREEQEMNKLLEEREKRIKEEEEREKEYRAKLEDKEKQVRMIIDKQLEELKQKDILAEALRKEEAEILKCKDELQKVIEKREEECKRRQKQEIDLYNINQYRLKLRRRANIIAEEVATERRIYEQILEEQKLEEEENNKEKIQLKEAMKEALELMKRQEQLEVQRRDYLQFIFDSEAKMLWDQQEKVWRQEKLARDRLFNDVMEGIRKQIQEKAAEKIEKQKELLFERERMIEEIEKTDNEIKQEKLEHEKKHLQLKEELNKQIREKKFTAKELEAMEKCEEARKVQEAQEEEKRLRKEIEKIQLDMTGTPLFFPRRRIVW